MAEAASSTSSRIFGGRKQESALRKYLLIMRKLKKAFVRL